MTSGKLFTLCRKSVSFSVNKKTKVFFPHGCIIDHQIGSCICKLTSLLIQMRNLKLEKDLIQTDPESRISSYFWTL